MARRRARSAEPRSAPVGASLDQLLRQADPATRGAPPADDVPTGFPSVDRVVGGGLRRGDLTILGGDIGSGKSALALAMALRAASSGCEVAFYAGETAAWRVAERILAIEGRARVDELRRGILDPAVRAQVLDAVSRLGQASLVVARLPASVDLLAKGLDRRGPTALVVVDPLQMLASGRMTQDEELALSVRQLKALAVDMHVALLVTAHLPNLTARADRRPQLDDFGALGAVKQHADVVLGLFREGMYDPARSLEGATELHVLKNRGGPTSYVDLYFYERWMRFEDLVDPDR